MQSYPTGSNRPDTERAFTAKPRIAVLGRERNRIARLVAIAQARELAAREAALPFTEKDRSGLDLLVLDAGGLAAEDRLWVRGVLAEAGMTPVIVVTDAADFDGAVSLIAEGVDDVLDWTTLTSAALARAARITLARKEILPQSAKVRLTDAPAPMPLPAQGALTLLQECASAIMLVDPEGIVQFANPEAEALLGVPEGALTGAPFALEVNNGDREEVTLDGPEGRQIQAEVRIVETEHGNVPMRVVTLQDMSLRRALTRHFAA